MGHWEENLHDKSKNIFAYEQTYMRHNIATGIQLKKYYDVTTYYMDDEKKSLFCIDDHSWASRIQNSDKFDNKEFFRGNGKSETEEDGLYEGMGTYLQIYKEDREWKDSLMFDSCSRVALILDNFGKPGREKGGKDKTRFEWFIKAEAAHCEHDIMMDARPMCVVSGPDVPQAIKDQAIDIQAAGAMAEKIEARQNAIQMTVASMEWWKGFWLSIWNIFMLTYGFLGCCFCCCQLPLCWEGWACGKGGFCWERACCLPCRLVCYGGFCGWRCRQKVKDEEAADILEAEKRKAEKDAESSSGSSSGSSSSDSD